MKPGHKFNNGSRKTTIIQPFSRNQFNWVTFLRYTRLYNTSWYWNAK